MEVGRCEFVPFLCRSVGAFHLPKVFEGELSLFSLARMVLPWCFPSKFVDDVSHVRREVLVLVVSLVHGFVIELQGHQAITASLVCITNTYDSLVSQLGVKIALIVSYVLDIIEARKVHLKALVEFSFCFRQLSLRYQFEEVSKIESGVECNPLKALVQQKTWAHHILRKESVGNATLLVFFKVKPGRLQKRDGVSFILVRPTDIDKSKITSYQIRNWTARLMSLTVALHFPSKGKFPAE